MPIFDYSCELGRSVDTCLAQAFQEHIYSILYLFDNLEPPQELEEGIAEEIDKTVRKYLNLPQNPLELKGALAPEYLCALQAPARDGLH